MRGALRKPLALFQVVGFGWCCAKAKVPAKATAESDHAGKMTGFSYSHGASET